MMFLTKYSILIVVVYLSIVSLLFSSDLLFIINYDRHVYTPILYVVEILKKQVKPYESISLTTRVLFTK